MQPSLCDPAMDQPPHCHSSHGARGLCLESNPLWDTPTRHSQCSGKKSRGKEHNAGPRPAPCPCPTASPAETPLPAPAPRAPSWPSLGAGTGRARGRLECGGPRPTPALAGRVSKSHFRGKSKPPLISSRTPHGNPWAAGSTGDRVREGESERGTEKLGEKLGRGE